MREISRADQAGMAKRNSQISDEVLEDICNVSRGRSMALLADEEKRRKKRRRR
ncbi:MAG TPA: hypothetical protein PLS83_11725 [Methanothrix soehngenii]|nr:hypothetical protein [Methanothrix soehngenii]